MDHKQIFLERYLRWCLGQVHDELEAGMPNLNWIGHPIFEFLVLYLSQKSIAQGVELFSAMQYRKLCHQGVRWDSNKKTRHEAILEEFTDASDKHNDSRTQDLDEIVRRANFEPAKSTLTKRLAWQGLKGLGWQKIPWNPGVLKCSMGVDEVTVSTFLSSETREFCYWQQVVDGSGDILLETSFAEWFGLGHYTIFIHNQRGSEERIAEFVVAKSQLFLDELRAFLR